MGIASHECCEHKEGFFGCNWIWIALLIIIFCGGFDGRGCGIGGLFDGGLFGNSSIWILVILFIIFFSGKKIF